MRPRTSESDAGWINRRFARLERMIRESSAAKRLQAATIGAGGVTVKDAGQIRVLYPDGQDGLTLGPILQGGVPAGAIVQMLEENGESNVFTLYRIVPGAVDTYPDGLSQMQLSLDNFQVGVGGMFLVSGGDGGGTIYMTPDVGLLLSHPNGVRIDHATTAAGANCYIDPVSSVIYRVSSSLRYKQDITDAEVDVDAVLALVPRAYRRKDDVEELGDDAPTYVGFVAEEAADLGLDDWVTSDEEGPESFTYSMWPVAQQAVIRAQQARIEALEAAVAELRGHA